MIYKGKVNKRAAISLISVGAFNGPKNLTDRKTMLYEFDSWQQLTAREQGYIFENYKKFNTLYDCVNDLLTNFKVTSKRQQVIVDINQALANPFYGVKDSVATIAQDEEKLMGCALTCSRVDDTEEASYATMCRDIANGAITGKANIVVSISSVRQYKTKNGKNPGQLMAFICAEDSSGMLDSITVFPEAFEEYKDLLVEGNTVLINGEASKRDKTSIIVNKVRQV
jgi:DNA polymerase III alpha subunit